MSINVISNTDSKETAIPAKNAAAETLEKEVQTSASAQNEQDEIADESETSESHSDENQDEKSEGTKEGEVVKKKSGFEKRINKLNAKLSEEAREKEYWKREALKGKQEPEKHSESQRQLSRDEGKPEAKNFETQEDYLEALADWKIDQRDKKALESKRNEDVKSAYQKQAEAYGNRLNKYKNENPDFVESLEEFTAEHGDVHTSPALEQLIIESEMGPAIINELIKDKAEFDRINSLSPLAAARAIGAIEARLAKTSEQTKEVKTTKAPAPVRPLGGTKSGSAKKTIYDKDLSQAEYESLRKEQMKKRA